MEICNWQLAMGNRQQVIGNWKKIIENWTKIDQMTAKTKTCHFLKKIWSDFGGLYKGRFLTQNATFFEIFGYPPIAYLTF